MDSLPSAQGPQLTVGIGASAGGVQALRTFFEQVPADSGAAYVVVLHLSPDHESQLANVLQSVASIPVAQVTEGVRLEPDRVYVAAPNSHLTMDEGELKVSPNADVQDRRAPVDIFFRSLADSQGPRAVCVVLSGAGADGSTGLKFVKEKGGAVLAQNPREAEFGEMPRSAIATGFVDGVLSAAHIPARIAAYRERLASIELSPEAPLGVAERPKDEQAMRDIFARLRSRTGHDFSEYKRSTLLRRIARRVSVHDLEGLPAYAAYLQHNPDEAQLLLKDLLISVTSFFRDAKAFEALERTVLPRLFEGKGPGDQVRAWVVGCATGEEAYSMAMLLFERTQGVSDPPTVQVFATDIDESALAVAREGRYTPSDVADVSPERLSRYFDRVGDGYRVRPELREKVLFARHNVLKDLPFLRLDLATCRNLLIYLNQQAQKRVLETLHFALEPGAYLMLGASESMEGAKDLYTNVDRERHIYQSRAVEERRYPLPSLMSAPNHEQPKPAPLQERGRAGERLSYGELHARLLEAYAPPSVVVDEKYELVHLSEHAGRYLRVAGGEPTTDLLDLVRPELRAPLRMALDRAVQSRASVDTGALRLEDGEAVDLHVRPVMTSQDVARGFILVLFEKAEAESAREAASTSEEPLVRRLEAELGRLRAELRLSSEQYEVQTEELRASNEELQALNEELRSSAEELETSWEELQSINEELTAVNEELKLQVEETTQASNNLRNLIDSTDIGVIFLDRGLRVQLVSPTAQELFDVLPTDVGRPLAGITHRLDHPELLEDVEAVLERLSMVEREVGGHGGRSYLMRVLPYRTADDHIDGVVVTFVDISQRKRAEEALRASEEKMRLIVESATDFAIFATDQRLRVTSWNKGAEALFGYAEGEMLGRPAEVLFTPEDREEGVPEWEASTARSAGSAENERWHLRKDGSRFFGSGLVHPLRDSSGAPIGFVKILRGLTERKRREVFQTLLVGISDDLNTLVTADEIMQAVGSRLGTHMGLSSCVFVDVDDRRDRVTVHHGWTRGNGSNPELSFRLSEYMTDEFARAQRAGELVAIDDTSQDERADATANASLGIGASLSVPFHREGRWTASVVVTDSAPRAWRPEEIELARDVAERVFPRIERARAEEALRLLNETLEQQVEERTEAWLSSRARFEQAFHAGPMASVITTLEEDRFLDVNASFTELTGYAPEEVKGRRAKELGMWSSEEDQAKTEAALAQGDGFRHLELSLRTKRGDVRDILISAQRIELEGDQGWLKMFLDITERNRTQEELMDAIESVMTDTDWFSRRVVERLSHIRSGPKDAVEIDELLSARELEVLGHVANGLNDAAIAKELGLSRKTVRNHVVNIYAKIGVHSRVEAVLWARERGIS